MWLWEMETEWVFHWTWITSEILSVTWSQALWDRWHSWTACRRPVVWCLSNMCLTDIVLYINSLWSSASVHLLWNCNVVIVRNGTSRMTEFSIELQLPVKDCLCHCDMTPGSWDRWHSWTACRRPVVWCLSNMCLTDIMLHINSLWSPTSVW